MSGNTIKHVQGDRYPIVTATLRDRNGTDADPSDPDTWPIVDLSSGLNLVRVDYRVQSKQAIDVLPTVAGNLFALDLQPFSNDERVRLSTSDTFPTGFLETTLYYIISANENDFQLSLTEGGSAVAVSDVGAGQTNALKQFDVAAATLVGDGTAGEITFIHPPLVWENPGDYELEYVVLWTAPAGKETVYDTDTLELRPR